MFFSSLVIFMMLSSTKIDIYALKKDNYISISLEVPKVQTSPKKSVVTPVAQESVVEQKDVNIDDLFSDVWTKNIKKKKQKQKQKIDNKRLIEIGKKSKKIDKESAKPALKKINAQKSDDTHKASTANEVNEYLAKIQALVYENFVPPQNSQGHTVKAVIELSSLGKVMDFRILSYSANSNLNDECDKIKKRLMGVLFPANPKNKSGNYIVELTSEE